MSQAGDVPAAQAPPASSPAVPLQVSGLRFRWKEDGPDVLDVDALSVAVGERVFLGGPSGCGKSTLLSLLGGVVVPRAGEIRVLGTALPTLSASRRDRFRADHIGVIFQMFNLVPYLSLVENVALPCHFSAVRRTRARARSSGIDDEAQRLLAALGLSDERSLSAPVSELSIGQQQRVAAARALIGAPEILIADEPTSALDEGTRERFLELLFDECRRAETTLVFVSHDLRLGALFDRTITLPALNAVNGGGG